MPPKKTGTRSMPASVFSSSISGRYMGAIDTSSPAR